jgi:hypothetical protein
MSNFLWSIYCLQYFNVIMYLLGSTSDSTCFYEHMFFTVFMILHTGLSPYWHVLYLNVYFRSMER